MKRSIKIAVISTLLLCITIPTVMILNIYSEAKNYKDVLKPKNNMVISNHVFSDNTNAMNAIQAMSASTNDLPHRDESHENSWDKSNEDNRDEFNEDNRDESNENNKEDYSLQDSYINILFLGTDKLQDSPSTNMIKRSDTIAVVRINLDKMSVDVLSIPRDSYVYIPLTNKNDKINHAFAYGSHKGDGVKSAMDTVNEFIKYAKIDYFFTIDLAPIPDIVDSLGGVELDVEIDMKTHGANLSKGFQLLDGTKAFDYIHWRYSSDGDIGRIRRQQKFFKAMYSKLRETKQITDAVRIILSYKNNINTDMSHKQIVSLALFANDITEESTRFHTIPGSAELINNISYWIPDAEKTDELLKKLFVVE